MKKLPQLRWYYFTRAIAAVTLLYEVPFDHTPERGTIVLAAMGLLGIDWVSRQAKNDKD